MTTLSKETASNAGVVVCLVGVTMVFVAIGQYDWRAAFLILGAALTWVGWRVI